MRMSHPHELRAITTSRASNYCAGSQSGRQTPLPRARASHSPQACHHCSTEHPAAHGICHGHRASQRAKQASSRASHLLALRGGRSCRYDWTAEASDVSVVESSTANSSGERNCSTVSADRGEERGGGGGQRAWEGGACRCGTRAGRLKHACLRGGRMSSCSRRWPCGAAGTVSGDVSLRVEQRLCEGEQRRVRCGRRGGRRRGGGGEKRAEKVVLDACGANLAQDLVQLPIEGGQLVSALLDPAAGVGGGRGGPPLERGPRPLFRRGGRAGSGRRKPRPRTRQGLRFGRCRGSSPEGGPSLGDERVDV